MVITEVELLTLKTTKNLQETHGAKLSVPPTDTGVLYENKME